MAASTPNAPPSALQSLLNASKLDRQASPNLALQIAHNLHYQHNWTAIRLHAPPSHSPGGTSRPILSGVPPQRLYVHPDEQIELLQQQKAEGKSGLPELIPQREWVLPSHLREKWSLRRFGEVFDGIAKVPSHVDGELLFGGGRDVGGLSSNGQPTNEDDSPDTNLTWRSKLPKRLLLATVDDDSTVVYYIVHDGIVKPRQN